MDWAELIPGTNNFTWGEFFVTSHDQDLLRREFLSLSVASQTRIKQHIMCLANRLQAVRDTLGGKAITITSGWRSERVNTAVGGARNSYHKTGQAADIEIAGMSPSRVQEWLKGWAGGLGLTATFTHVDIGPDRQPFRY